MSIFTKKDALDYHSEGRPGKIEVIPTKPHNTQRDLSLAYTPGVAEPCLEIKDNPMDVYKYTAKSNLVAVISNGTAVLGLGNIGAAAGKPVMEGKGLLFKIFGDIDVFDIEVDTEDVEKFIETVKLIAVTFGGINLEDIKAPQCFEIETRLKKELDIPVMHDDQHGTAIISAAGLINAIDISGKDMSKVKMVVSGAGAAAIACTKLYMSLGIKKEHVVMCDSKGPITKFRDDLNEFKKEFAIDRDLKSMAEALEGSDLFLGLSVKGALTKDMLAAMAPNPIIFAMANPDPEITFEDAYSVRNDLIFATGRSDYPNQINNVLGFPFIFRGALDVHATAINEEMKVASAKALAQLAREPVPEIVNKAYNTTNLKYGKDYIIPKPLDPRLIYTVAVAVAKAAIESGVARTPVKNWDQYKEELKKRMGLDNKLMDAVSEKARKNPKRVVFAEGEHDNILKAVQVLYKDKIALPVLLGKESEIRKNAGLMDVDLSGIEIINPLDESMTRVRNTYANMLFEKRQRKGMSKMDADDLVLHRDWFGIMMVENNEADAFISGTSTKYADIIRPALQIVGTQPEVSTIAGMYLMNTKGGAYFFSDTTVNVDMTAEKLVDITLLTAEEVRKFNIEPVIALLSYSNFGSSRTNDSTMISRAVSILHKKHPNLIVDGEMQANFAVNKELRKKRFPFSKLGDKKVNTLIFPDLNSGNVAYKLMLEMGGCEAIGPILMGINKSVHILQLESSVREIINMTTIAVVDAQNK
jgi:malate dehydrogenase (oxaloacetate-decarboxylating)(NADP+)